MKNKSRHTPIKETLHQVLGKMKMYKIPASPNWYYEFWIGKCKLFPKGKRERKSTDETKYTIAKEIATENYKTYLSAKKNNKIKQIGKCILFQKCRFSSIFRFLHLFVRFFRLSILFSDFVF